MRVPLGWLADYVTHPWLPEELGRRLTMSGLKVEAIERPSEGWSDIRIGQVIDVSLHPRSNKPLWVTHVHYGDGVVEIVTGAPNVFAGAKVPVVLVGGSVPYGPGGAPLRIDPRPMAGIVSNGMLCSPGELGLEGDDSGIMILPDEAPLGLPLGEYLGDEVLDIETVSNRPDTLSITGVAREVAALVPAPLRLPDLSAVPPRVEQRTDQSIAVEIADPDLCSRYSALRVDGLTVVRSPEWLVRRIEAAGIRAINLPVDLTNYVMVELGQPMHAFDASRLSGDRIVVRRARPAEMVRTLDGVDRALPPDALVIADGERAVAVAGVMGGEESEITDTTTSLILESANFNAPSVRRTAQALGLRTDASSRFEKGLPPETTVSAIQRFVQLLAEITGDPIVIHAITDVWPVQPEERTVRMPMRDVHRLLGIDVSAERASAVLQLLGFGVETEGTTLVATVPYWRRVDIQRSADLVEEVGRIVGFDQIPTTLPFRTLQPPVPSPGWFWEGRVRSRLLATGVNEAVTHSLTSTAHMARASRGLEPSSDENWRLLVANPDGVERHGATARPVELSNPATVDRQVLRLTLVPDLLDVVDRNLKYVDERVAFFEIARTYFPLTDGELAYERRTLALALSGVRTPRTWERPEPGGFTFYDMKGLVETVLDEMHVDAAEVRAASHPMLHPGRSATLWVSGQEIGYFGELHPELAARLNLDTWPVQVAELDLDALVDLARDDPSFQSLPRFPSAFRDIAIVVARDLPSARVLEVVRSVAGQLLQTARVFDVYEGPGIGEGKKSLAFELSFVAGDRTLTQAEVDEVMARIVTSLRSEVGAVLRE
jgi:phenylalanyl-tRNA synthetase beta chain